MNNRIKFKHRLKAGDGEGYTVIVEAIQTPDILMENDEMTTILTGEVVYCASDDHILRAVATSLAEAEAIGLCSGSISPGTTGFIRADGFLELDTTVWDSLIEEPNVGGLGTGIYYLSATTPGKLTANAPTAEGTYVTIIGRRITSRILKIEIEYPMGN